MPAVANSNVQPDNAAALYDWLLYMGDSTLIQSHRLSEWCGHAPALEEDIALANTALDLLGQAQLWLELASEHDAANRSPDELAFLRDANEYRNALLVELPNEDFGNTLVKQYFFDLWHKLLLEKLRDSTDKRLAAIAEKAYQEVSYHLERSSDLVVRLGDGTQESHQRMQEAVNRLWPYTGELMLPMPADEKLGASGLIPDAAVISQQWNEHVKASLVHATLSIPDESFMQRGGRTGVHTEHLGYLLSEMQFLQRAYPNSTW